MTPTPDSHPWMVRRYCVQRPGESGYTAHPCVSRAAALEIFSVKSKPGETMVELLKWETPSNGGSGRHPWLRTVGVRRRRNVRPMLGRPGVQQPDRFNFYADNVVKKSDEGRWVLASDYDLLADRMRGLRELTEELATQLRELREQSFTTTTNRPINSSTQTKDQHANQ